MEKEAVAPEVVSGTSNEAEPNANAASLTGAVSLPTQGMSRGKHEEVHEPIVDYLLDYLKRRDSSLRSSNPLVGRASSREVGKPLERGVQCLIF